MNDDTPIEITVQQLQRKVKELTAENQMCHVQILALKESIGNYSDKLSRICKENSRVCVERDVALRHAGELQTENDYLKMMMKEEGDDL